MESIRRSVARAVSYRFLGTLTTATLVFLLLDKLELAAAVGVLDSLFKLFVYVAHERTWNLITYGHEQQQTEYFI